MRCSGGKPPKCPVFTLAGEYDLAGFCVGIVEKVQLMAGSRVNLGDIAIGLASQGVHSNGFSLVRKIVSQIASTTGRDAAEIWGDRPELLRGQTLGEVLLTPTQIYVKPVLAARQAGLDIHSMAHITGGGLPENLPRCLGANQTIQLDPNHWSPPPIFEWLTTVGQVSAGEMFNTFNMGIGFVLLVPPKQAEQTVRWFESQGVTAYPLGEVISGTGELVGLPES